MNNNLCLWQNTWTFSENLITPHSLSMVEIPSHEMRIVSSGTLVSMLYPEGVPSSKDRHDFSWGFGNSVLKKYNPMSCLFWWRVFIFQQSTPFTITLSTQLPSQTFFPPFGGAAKLLFLLFFENPFFPNCLRKKTVHYSWRCLFSKKKAKQTHTIHWTSIFSLFPYIYH